MQVRHMKVIKVQEGREEKETGKTGGQRKALTDKK